MSTTWMAPLGGLPGVGVVVLAVSLGVLGLISYCRAGAARELPALRDLLEFCAGQLASCPPPTARPRSGRSSTRSTRSVRPTPRRGRPCSTSSAATCAIQPRPRPPRCGSPRWNRRPASRRRRSCTAALFRNEVAPSTGRTCT